MRRRLQTDFGQSLAYEYIDRILTSGNRCFDRRLIGPVPLILGPLLDPPLEDLFLTLAERLVRIGWRHALFRIGGQHTFDHRAFGRVARRNRTAVDGFIAQIKPQIGLAVSGIRPMTGEAVVGKDGAHITVELDLLRQRRLIAPPHRVHQQRGHQTE